MEKELPTTLGKCCSKDGLGYPMTVESIWIFYPDSSENFSYREQIGSVRCCSNCGRIVDKLKILNEKLTQKAWDSMLLIRRVPPFYFRFAGEELRPE